ncbi:carbonic anhydrase 1-like [Zerene cesonia]|uniref:carbonic anhydrase 1-like n=1 Tax=Zerene cesonia TaxID=33412 RepID=UPI0018E50C49|nr:carbonic anhydrase 1-like [Zerene cesonia]
MLRHELGNLALAREDCTQDQTTTRPNTLLDDADDIQRQLDNEVRDRLQYGQPKTIWVFHLPTQFPEVVTSPSNLVKRFHTFSKTKHKKQTKENEKDQHKWYQDYPECNGRSQSPINIPTKGLITAKHSRSLVFANYDLRPHSYYIRYNRDRFILFGFWDPNHRPMVYGGAGHSRRYLFHSMTLRWPSEHKIEGVQCPLETQVLHISAEYRTMRDAIAASPRDRLAFLGIVNLFMYQNTTQRGVKEVIMAMKTRTLNSSILQYPLSFFNPPFKKYACYQGSLTAPPCTEAVLWLIRAKSLPITRHEARSLQNLMTEEYQGSHLRQTQPLNDRKIYLFN